MKEHGFNLTEIEQMLPYERDIYIITLIEYIKKKQKQQEGFK